MREWVTVTFIVTTAPLCCRVSFVTCNIPKQHASIGWSMWYENLANKHMWTPLGVGASLMFAKGPGCCGFKI